MGRSPDGAPSRPAEPLRPSPACRRSRTRDLEMDSAQRSRQLRSTAISTAIAIVILVLGLAGGARPAAAAESSVRVPVLMYHRISAPPPGAKLPHLWVA